MSYPINNNLFFFALHIYFLQAPKGHKKRMYNIFVSQFALFVSIMRIKKHTKTYLQYFKMQNVFNQLFRMSFGMIIANVINPLKTICFCYNT